MKFKIRISTEFREALKDFVIELMIEIISGVVAKLISGGSRGRHQETNPLSAALEVGLAA